MSDRISSMGLKSPPAKNWWQQYCCFHLHTFMDFTKKSPWAEWRVVSSRGSGEIWRHPLPADRCVSCCWRRRLDTAGSWHTTYAPSRTHFSHSWFSNQIKQIVYFLHICISNRIIRDMSVMVHLAHVWADILLCYYWGFVIISTCKYVF